MGRLYLDPAFEHHAVVRHVSRTHLARDTIDIAKIVILVRQLIDRLHDECLCRMRKLDACDVLHALHTIDVSGANPPPST
eukprot:3769605-Prymnesium_polylepis.1